MKFSAFNPWPVYGVPTHGEWPVAPRLSTPSATLEGMRCGIEVSKLADRVGFDYVTVAEHHYHPRQLSPNPLLAAAALAQHLTHTGVAVLGATLPLVNPIRTAEEVAMVDALTGGNLLIGLFRGTPHEFLTYGTTPQESREVFEEAVDLMLAAWTEPEPFSWVGRYYDYRTVAVWPRPVSTPHPPILVSANSPTSAAYAAKRRFKAGISFAPQAPTARMVSAYVEAAEQAGWTPGPEDILHRGLCFVAETDAEAERIVAQYGFGIMGGANQTNDYGVTAALRAAMSGGSAPGGQASPPPAGSPAAGGPPTMSRPHFMGSPDTVANQLREFAEATGVGHFDLIFNDLVMDFGHACRAVELFGTEVIPQLRKSMVAA